MTTCRWLMLALLATTLHASCRRMPWSTGLTGTVEASGSQGSYRLTLTECKNGRHDAFFGVWLRDRQNPRRLLRIAKSPESGALVVSTSDGGPLQVARDCHFSSQVLRDDSGTGEVVVMAGAIEFKCTDLSGSVRFDNCYSNWE